MDSSHACNDKQQHASSHQVVERILYIREAELEARILQDQQYIVTNHKCKQTLHRPVR